jgi:hypothetical protein
MTSATDFLQRRWVLLAGFALVLGVFVWTSREPQLTPGSHVDYIFTLVPADAQGLACASAEPIAGQRCAFSDESTSATLERPLRPCTLITGEIVLLAGVFEDPAIAKWVEQSIRAKDDQRVTVRCDGTFLGRAPSAKVRWATDGRFAQVPDLQVGNLAKCRVTSAP